MEMNVAVCSNAIGVAGWSSGQIIKNTIQCHSLKIHFRQLTNGVRCYNRYFSHFWRSGKRIYKKEIQFHGRFEKLQAGVRSCFTRQ